MRFATRSIVGLAVGVACLALSARSAFADSITLAVVAQGWYTDGMCHNCGEQVTPGWTNNNDGWPFAETRNYFTGFNTGHGGIINSYFAFDLSTVTDPIDSASLYLYNSGYQGVDAFETLHIYEVTTAPAIVLSENIDADASAIASDLGAGSVFGSIVVDTSVVGLLQIQINALGLAALNDAIGGVFVFGGSLATVNQMVVQEGMFSGSGSALGCPVNLLQIGGGEPTPVVCPDPPPQPVPETTNTMVALLASLGVMVTSRRL